MVKCSRWLLGTTKTLCLGVPDINGPEKSGPLLFSTAIPPASIFVVALIQYSHAGACVVMAASEVSPTARYGFDSRQALRT